MKIFGIDPGSVVTAYGVIHTHRGRIRYVDSGCIRTKSSQPMGYRLATIYDGLLAAVQEHQPDAVAIESIFRHRSSESALRLGQARGVALLAVGKCGYEAAEYNPMTVKKSVGAHGRADKKAVAKVVQLLLGVKLDGPADITDALAIAITHCAHAKTAALRGVS
jgi:crossover junction endodeoxyribonuclease RuvC